MVEELSDMVVDVICLVVLGSEDEVALRLVGELLDVAAPVAVSVVVITDPVDVLVVRLLKLFPATCEHVLPCNRTWEGILMRFAVSPSLQSTVMVPSSSMLAIVAAYRRHIKCSLVEHASSE